MGSVLSGARSRCHLRALDRLPARPPSADGRMPTVAVQRLAAHLAALLRCPTSRSGVVVDYGKRGARRRSAYTLRGMYAPRARRLTLRVLRPRVPLVNRQARRRPERCPAARRRPIPVNVTLPCRDVHSEPPCSTFSSSRASRSTFPQLALEVPQHQPQIPKLTLQRTHAANRRIVAPPATQADQPHPGNSQRPSNGRCSPSGTGSSNRTHAPGRDFAGGAATTSTCSTPSASSNSTTQARSSTSTLAGIEHLSPYFSRADATADNRSRACRNDRGRLFGRCPASSSLRSRARSPFTPDHTPLKPLRRPLYGRAHTRAG